MSKNTYKQGSTKRKADDFNDERPYKDWSTEQLLTEPMAEGGEEVPTRDLVGLYAGVLDTAQESIMSTLERLGDDTGGIVEELGALGFDVRPFPGFTRSEYHLVWNHPEFPAPVPPSKYETKSMPLAEFSLYRAVDLGEVVDGEIPPFVVRQSTMLHHPEANLGVYVALDSEANFKGGAPEAGEPGGVVNQGTQEFVGALATTIRRASARKYFTQKRKGDFMSDRREQNLRNNSLSRHTNSAYPQCFLIPPIPMEPLTHGKKVIEIGFTEHLSTMRHLSHGYDRPENSEWFVGLNTDNTVMVSYGHEYNQARHAIGGARKGLTPHQKAILLDFLNGMVNKEDWVDLELGWASFFPVLPVLAAINKVSAVDPIEEPIPTGLVQSETPQEEEEFDPSAITKMASNRPSKGLDHVATEGGSSDEDSPMGLFVTADEGPEGSASASGGEDRSAALSDRLISAAENSKGLMIEVVRVGYKIEDGWTTKTEVYISEEPGYPDDRIMKIEDGAKSPVTLATTVVAELLGLEKDDIPVKEAFYLQMGDPPKETPPNKVTEEEYMKAIKKSVDKGEKVEGAQKRTAIIKKLPNGKYRLYSHKGKNLGTFDSRSQAEKHEQEVNFFKSKGSKHQASDEFLAGYLIAAIWSSSDNSDDQGGTPLDNKGYSMYDFTPEAMERAKTDCGLFQDKAGELLLGTRMERAGHDFWLTRNGHGAGFWDSPEEYGGEEIANALTELAHSFGEIYVEETGDGKLDFM